MVLSFPSHSNTILLIQLTTLFTIFTLSSSSTSSSNLNTTLPFKKIYAFGDSFTDTGNTKSITGPAGFGHVSNSPYGITFFHRPTNRYSDGRLVIDFVTESLSLPFLPPYKNLDKNNKISSEHGVNFAVAGSTAIGHEFFVKNNLSLDITPESIGIQLVWFEKYLKESEGDGGGGRFDDNLFWVGEIGVNDYAYTVGSSIPDDVIRELGVVSVTKFLQAILKKGAKYVLVQGLPPSGCLPLAMSLAAVDDRDDVGCVKSVNNQTYTHNLALQAKLQDLRKQFPQATITYADYWNAYRTVMKNLSRFGFQEPFKACCGSGEPYNFDIFSVCGSRPSVTACKSPSQYINWDGVHLTEAMYKVLSDMFIRGNFTDPQFGNLLDKKWHRG